MKLFVGLDINSEKLNACFMTDDSTCSVLREASYGNNRPGASQIEEHILESSQKFEIESLVIGVEATSLYSFHPAMFFKKDLELSQLNLMISVEQPNKIKKYRDIFEENKNDQIDTLYIAGYFRVQRQIDPIIKEEEYLAPQHLTRTRYQLIKQLVRTKQHFIENTYYKCNTLSRGLKAEGRPVLSTTLVTLMTKDYAMDQLAELSLGELVDLVRKLGKYRFKNSEGITKAISKTIRSSYRLRKIHQDSVDTVLGVLAKGIRSLKKLIKDLDRTIDDLVVVLPEYQCLTSIPGIGPVYAVGVLAEVGPINRFSDESKLAKYAGLYWRQNQPGSSEHGSTPMAKRGDRYLHYYLVEATNSVRRREPEYHAYCRKKYAEAPKHKRKRAIVLTARKFTRLVDALLRNHQLYMPPRGAIDK